LSPPRRRRPGTYRPPRDRREIVVAVVCALGVLVVTVTLLFVLRPRDEGSDTPDAPPVSVPLPTDSVPTETVPTETAPAPPAS
jgi:hypothetical protein